jgi:hypothetical protein
LIYGRALATGFGASLDVLHVVANPFLQATVVDPECPVLTVPSSA